MLSARALACALLLAAAPALAAPAAARPGAVPRAEAALRLPALSERIAKLHVQVAHGVLAERSRRALPQALLEFDAMLRAAGQGDPGAESRDEAVLLRLLWRDYRAAAARPATPAQARRLIDRAEEVTWVAAKEARMAGPAAIDSPATNAARVAMLAQRAVRVQILKRAAHGRGAEGEADLRELRGLLERLQRGPMDAQVAGELQVAENQLEFLRAAARELEEGGATRSLETLAKSGDHILESMQRLVRLYGAS